jgi:hypothetical protein
MDKPVFTTPQADLQIVELDAWWREHRDKAPRLFEQELALARTYPRSERSSQRTSPIAASTRNPPERVGLRTFAHGPACAQMGRDDDPRIETPPGFGQTLGSPELAPDMQARPTSTAEHAAQTDVLIREDVARVLEDSSDDAQGVTATVQDAEVTLVGTVADTSAKETLEAAIERVPGVKRVHSQLRTS